MVKGIVNAFDHMGFCLVLNLTTTRTDGELATNIATWYVSVAISFYTG